MDSLPLDYYKIPPDVLTGPLPPDWVRLRLSIDVSTESSFFLHSNIGPLHKTGRYRGFYADIGDLIIRITGHGLDTIYPNGLYVLCKSHQLKKDSDSGT